MQSFVSTFAILKTGSQKTERSLFRRGKNHEHIQYRMTLFAQTKIESFLKISMGKGERKVS